jgi:hypothetical protein
MIRKSMVYVLAFALAFAAFSCVEKTETTQTGEQAAPKVEAKPTPIQRGDTVVIELTVDTGPDMYLNGPKPVVVKVPGNTPFVFPHSEYFVTKPVFPMKIGFEVSEKAPAGIQQIDLALKLMFCKKKDDICVIKNALHSFKVEVEKGKRPEGVNIHTIPQTHRLKD